MSSSAKWFIAVIVGVVGVVALVIAVIYATVPIHELPGFVPGGHPGYGTYHKRGALTGLVAVVLLVVAVVVGMSARRGDAGPSPEPASGLTEQTERPEPPEPHVTPSTDAPDPAS